MSLYTVILNSPDGSVYIAQVKATSPVNAIRAWARTYVPGFPKKARAAFAKYVAQEGNNPTPIKGTDGVWCAGLIGDSWVNIVRTDKTKKKRPEPELDDKMRADILSLAEVIANGDAEEERQMCFNTLKFMLS